eukprot:345601-Amphidinium_carterae.3
MPDLRPSLELTSLGKLFPHLGIFRLEPATKKCGTIASVHHSCCMRKLHDARCCRGNRKSMTHAVQNFNIAGFLEAVYPRV